MKKYKTYGFWIALSGAGVVFINALGKCFGFSVEEQVVSDIIMSMAGILVVLGIVVMPKNKEEQAQTKDEVEEEDLVISEEIDDEITESKQDLNKEE